MSNEPEFITRRRFFCSLGAAAVVAGVALPIGLAAKVKSKEVLFTVTHKYWHQDFEYIDAPDPDELTLFNEKQARELGDAYAKSQGWSV